MHGTMESAEPILSALLAQLPTGVVIANREGTLEQVNEVARALFGEHRRVCPVAEPWSSRPVPNAAEPNDTLEPIHWIIARVLLTGEVVRNEEIQFLDVRDEWRTLCVSATPLENARGEITHALVSYIDVTATNRAREWEPLIRAISRL